MKILKEINLTIGINTDEETLSVVSYDPETGISRQADFGFNPEKHKRLDEWIGGEVYTWARTWIDSEREAEQAPGTACDGCAAGQDCERFVVNEPADNQISEEGYIAPYPTF